MLDLIEEVVLVNVGSRWFDARFVLVSVWVVSFRCGGVCLLMKLVVLDWCGFLSGLRSLSCFD